MSYHAIEFSRNFEKQFKKLPEKDKQKFYLRLKIFKQDPFNPVLDNHGLKGKYLGYRSIDIKGDLRALYTIKGNKIVIFGFIGTHSQLYG